MPGETLPTRSVSRFLSSVKIWDTLATDSFGSPVSRAIRETFPGAVARRRLLVRGTQTSVAIRLRFKESACTITTGLLNPGPEPDGTGRSAHHTSPCETSSWALKTRHHSERSNTRLAASATNLSVGCPHSSHDRFIASVISSGAWRAKYSLTASPYNLLRDFFVRRARRSAPWNTSSGMETAVFIP